MRVEWNRMEWNTTQQQKCTFCLARQHEWVKRGKCGKLLFVCLCKYGSGKWLLYNSELLTPHHHNYRVRTFKQQMLKCTNAQNLQTTNAEMHKRTNAKAQMPKCTNAQTPKCTNAKCSNAQRTKVPQLPSREFRVVCANSRCCVRHVRLQQQQLLFVIQRQTRRGMAMRNRIGIGIGFGICNVRFRLRIRMRWSKLQKRKNTTNKRETVQCNVG